MKKSIYSKITKKYQKDLMKSLKGFVAIDSSNDEKTVSKKDPFGKGVSEALKFMENLAKKDGFVVNNYSNKIVEILYGEGKKNLTIIHDALKEKGYNPVNQIVGYILSEDPTYITTHQNARNIIRHIDRDELLQVLVRSYLNS